MGGFRSVTRVKLCMLVTVVGADVTLVMAVLILGFRYIPVPTGSDFLLTVFYGSFLI